MTAPCYGCAYRQAGCHSVCERYISWKKELEAEKGVQQAICADRCNELDA